MMSLGGGEMGGLGGLGGMMGGGGGFQPMGLLQMLTGGMGGGSPDEEAAAPALETKQLPGYSGGAGAIPLHGKLAQQSRGQPGPAGGSGMGGMANAFDGIGGMTENLDVNSAMQFLVDNLSAFNK